MSVASENPKTTRCAHMMLPRAAHRDLIEHHAFITERAQELVNQLFIARAWTSAICGNVASVTTRSR
jgi:hypothetical protein